MDKLHWTHKFLQSQITSTQKNMGREENPRHMVFHENILTSNQSQDHLGRELVNLPSLHETPDKNLLHPVTQGCSIFRQPYGCKNLLHNPWVNLQHAIGSHCTLEAPTDFIQYIISKGIKIEWFEEDGFINRVEEFFQPGLCVLRYGAALITAVSSMIWDNLFYRQIQVQECESLTASMRRDTPAGSGAQPCRPWLEGGDRKQLQVPILVQIRIVRQELHLRHHVARSTQSITLLGLPNHVHQRLQLPQAQDDTRRRPTLRCRRQPQSHLAKPCAQPWPTPVVPDKLRDYLLDAEELRPAEFWRKGRPFLPHEGSLEVSGSLARANPDEEWAPALYEDLRNSSAVLVGAVGVEGLVGEGEGAAARGDIELFGGDGEIAEEQRGAPGCAGEAEERGRRAEDGELDVAAAEAGLTEDAAHDWIDQLAQLHLDASEGGVGVVVVLQLLLLVEVESVGVAALVRLGALDGSHEGVGDGGLGRGLLLGIAVTGTFSTGNWGGKAVEGAGERELEGLELEAGSVRGAASAVEGVA
ncbi:hypothetical protein Taro_049797 [Colocasia esculenta]|uniref:Uncharacterized protein n=1 Tax=Colocasia esculenta TaxID=4460 RepID=A0A843XC06_COLES|nr:hypothetical protein [Colocasia esculenta]